MSSHYSKASLRASLVHFLFGKALNAIVSLLTLVLLARWLAPDAYGVYIAFLALQSSLLAFSSLGIDATTERFIPELRTRYVDSKLLGFVLASANMRIASLLLLTLISWFFSKPITELVGLEKFHSAFQVWVFVIMLTGMLMFVVVLLEAMLHQRLAQICMSVYVVTKLVVLVIAQYNQQVNLYTLMQIELVATGVSALIGFWLSIRLFSGSGVHSGWQILLENSQRMQKFAFFNYFAQVAFQFFNADVMKLLVTRLLGVLQSAVYGFAYSLADTVQRYLPAVLLLRLIKPIFVSRYTKSGDFKQLNEMARIILKLNLLVLSPLIAFAMVFGGDFLSYLSNGKYAGAHWVFVSLLGLLVLSSHQLVLSILAGTLEKNSMQLYAGMVSMVAFPCALYLVPMIGSIGAVAASAMSGLLYNIFATFYLRQAGFDYSPDFRGGLIFLIGGITVYGLALFLNTVLSGWIGIALTLLVASVVYLLIVRFMSAFTNDERAMLNSILPKPIFIL
jgi:O-antigen/teichoic acid export membrane protein